MKPSPLFDGVMTGRAYFEGPYRYTLRRSWKPEAGRVVFLMLNPSTATGEILDPTVRRCLSFAMEWGFGELEVVNLFALVATDPHNLLRIADPVGPKNDFWLVESCTAASVKRVVCAWGRWGYLQQRAARVTAILQENGVDLWCLGKTKELEPKHPLYLRGDTQLVRL